MFEGEKKMISARRPVESVTAPWRREVNQCYSSREPSSTGWRYLTL